MNFANWCNGDVTKSAEIFYVKNYSNLSDFFLLKNTNLGAHFLLLAFFDNINFKSLYFLKGCPIFDSLPRTCHYSNSQNSIISF